MNSRQVDFGKVSFIVAVAYICTHASSRPVYPPQTALPSISTAGRSGLVGCRSSSLTSRSILAGITKRCPEHKKTEYIVTWTCHMHQRRSRPHAVEMSCYGGIEPILEVPKALRSVVTFACATLIRGNLFFSRLMAMKITTQML